MQVSFCADVQKKKKKLQKSKDKSEASNDIHFDAFSCDLSYHIPIVMAQTMTCIWKVSCIERKVRTCLEYSDSCCPLTQANMGFLCCHMIFLTMFAIADGSNHGM